MHLLYSSALFIPFISFYLLFVIIFTCIYIIFALLVLYYYFVWVYKMYICILALSNSTAELSSLCPYGVWSLDVWFGANQERTKALSDQMSFRNISECCFYDSLCHVFSYFFIIIVFIFPDVMTHDQLFFQWSKTLSWESSSSLKKHFPWFHGATDSCLSHGYFYINLPPIFMCLLPVVFTYLSKNKQKKPVLLLGVLSDRETWPHRANSALLTCCCWREDYFCEPIPKWLTDHLCVFTLL